MGARLGMLCLICVSSWASAQSPTETATARRLFAEGVELVDAERWDEAVERFRGAHALVQNGPIRFNLALALGRAGQVVEATELLRRVVAGNDADLAARAEAELPALVARLAEVVVRVRPSDARGALALDGNELPAALIGVAIPVDGGEHRVGWIRDDETVVERSLSVNEGGRAEVELEVPPEARVEASELSPEAVARAQPAEAEPDSPDRGVNGVAIGLGVTAAVVAVAVAVIVAVVVAGSPNPVRGNFEPGSVEWP